MFTKSQEILNHILQVKFLIDQDNYVLVIIGVLKSHINLPTSM